MIGILLLFVYPLVEIAVGYHNKMTWQMQSVPLVYLELLLLPLACSWNDILEEPSGGTEKAKVFQVLLLLCFAIDIE
jgi:hypothetical protein